MQYSVRVGVADLTLTRDPDTHNTKERNMAAWQFDLFLMPEGAAIPLDTEYGLEIPGLPLGDVRHIQENLIACFGPPWLMLEDWIVFGDEKGTRVDLIFDETEMVEIKARLDVSLNNDQMLDALCAIAKQLGWCYFDVQGRQFIKPEKQALLQAMSSSRAASFVKGPREFIAKLAASRK